MTTRRPEAYGEVPVRRSVLNNDNELAIFIWAMLASSSSAYAKTMTDNSRSNGVVNAEEEGVADGNDGDRGVIMRDRTDERRTDMALCDSQP